MVYIFSFNGENVGEINQYIKLKHFTNENKLYRLELNIQNNLTINVVKYKNLFPLIINEIKPIFSILNVRYNIVLIDGIKYLAYKNYNNIPLEEYVKESNYKNSLAHLDLQRLFVFNWLMCLGSNYENNIYVFPNSNNPHLINVKKSTNVFFISIKEHSFKYLSTDCIISRHIIKEYFNNSEEQFYKIAKNMVRDIDINALRQEMNKIVNKYDNDFIGWVNVVYDRITNLS